MNIDLNNLLFALSGSSFGFLYVLSMNYGENMTKQNLLKSLFKAFAAAVASVPLGGLAFAIVINTNILNNDLGYNPFLQGAISFVICVKHVPFMDLIFKKLFKSKDKKETE